MPEISVIVPVYKVEAYLDRCVKSILAQTFTDFELILVDDGSPDRCPEMCDTWAGKDSRIHVIHQKNGGLSAARNAGIDWAFANSDSRWLTFIDSDDWVHPKMLECLLFAATEGDVNISVCGYVETRGELSTNISVPLAYTLWHTEDFFVKHNTNAVIACGKLYCKAYFQDIRYPVGKIHEDEFITYRLLFRESLIALVETKLYFYFYNQEGITKSGWSVGRLDILEALEERREFFREQNNIKMVEYTERELEIRKAWLFLKAYKERKHRSFPDKYKMGFNDAIKKMQKYAGIDRYEAMLIHDYPLLVKIQAYLRKAKNLLGVH